jgi:hypothetical protein
MLNSEYEREFVYDIDSYLIEWYPTMDMQTRRSICSNAFDYIDPEVIEDSIDLCVAQFALEKLKIEKKELPDSDD